MILCFNFKFSVFISGIYRKMIDFNVLILCPASCYSYSLFVTGFCQFFCMGIMCSLSTGIFMSSFPVSYYSTLPTTSIEMFSREVRRILSVLLYSSLLWTFLKIFYSQMNGISSIHSLPGVLL